MSDVGGQNIEETAGLVDATVTRSHLESLITRAEIPAAVAARLMHLFAKTRNMLGKVTLIEEGEKKTIKTVSTKDITRRFVFPTSEQLDEDAKSDDEEVAARAKKLKRYEKRFDEAIVGGLDLHVTWLAPDDGEDKAIDAEQITGVILCGKA